MPSPGGRNRASCGATSSRHHRQSTWSAIFMVWSSRLAQAYRALRSGMSCAWSSRRCSELFTAKRCAMETKIEANKKTVLAFYEAGINNKDFDAASKFIGQRYV